MVSDWLVPWNFVSFLKSGGLMQHEVKGRVLYCYTLYIGGISLQKDWKSKQVASQESQFGCLYPLQTMQHHKKSLRTKEHFWRSFLADPWKLLWWRKNIGSRADCRWQAAIKLLPEALKASSLVFLLQEVSFSHLLASWSRQIENISIIMCYSGLHSSQNINTVMLLKAF